MARDLIRKLVGKKRGMVCLFDKDGRPRACTVLEVEPNVIAQVKRKESDGYEAIQLGFDEVRVKDPRTVNKRVSKPRRGHFEKAGIQPRRVLREMLVEDASQYEPGQVLTAAFLEGAEYLDVSGVSKGKGYQGVIKKYGFRGGPAAHGSGFHRHAGSTGMRSSPGRCLPGGPRPSHMGATAVTVHNVKVFSLDVEKGLIVVEGAVPGPKQGVVVISEAKKRLHKRKKK